MHDAIIIGGGPAGGFAAYLLGKAGRDILLVEQHAFPRDKVCGECLSSLGIAALQDTGLADGVRELGAVPLKHTDLYPSHGSRSRLSLEREMWGISRGALDRFLLNAAFRSGTRLLQPARVEQIAPEILVRDLKSNALRTIAARHVLLADGKGAFLHRRPTATGDFGIKAHFIKVDLDADCIALYGVANSYGGVAPIENGRWNAAFSVRGESLQAHRGQIDALFAKLQSENRSLQKHFRHAKRIGDWLVSPLPRFAVSQDWPDGVIPIGNAAAALEPIGGEGIGLALQSAKLAVEAILSGIDVRDLRRQFDSLWQMRRLACRAAAVALGSPALSSPVVSLSRNKPLASLALRLMGKRPRKRSNIPALRR